MIFSAFTGSLDALLGLRREHLENVLFNRYRHRDGRGLAWTHLFSRFGWLLDFQGPATRGDLAMSTARR